MNSTKINRLKLNKMRVRACINFRSRPMVFNMISLCHVLDKKHTFLDYLVLFTFVHTGVSRNLVKYMENGVNSNLDFSKLMGLFFTSSNYTKCKLICTWGNLNL